MELEVKKNEKGDLICEAKDGYNAGTKVNINEFMRWFGEDLTNGNLLNELGIIGVRYAIYAIKAEYMSIVESDILSNLLTLEYLYEAIMKSVTRADLKQKFIEIKKDLDFYQSEYNDLKRHKHLLQESLAEKDRLLDAKIAEIETLTEYLKTLKGENG